jgi:tRNA A-37 threonylcarbamoyl transferase component Bud32
MAILPILSALALRQLLNCLPEPSEGVGAVAGFLRDRFSDSSQRLPAALRRASERSWKALEIALAGESLGSFLERTEDRAFRQQVRAFLDATPLAGLPGHGPEFRQECLRELRAARRAGLLLDGRLEAAELAEKAADLARYSDPQARLEAEWRSLEQLALELRQAGHGALAHLVELRPAQGRPLLLLAVRYFFRREVESDEQLFRGLVLERTEELTEAQQAGFAVLEELLRQHGSQLDELLGLVAEVREGILDLQAELHRQGEQLQEFGQSVLRALQQHQLERRELRPHDSLSLRTEGERQLVRQLVGRYRGLPEEQRRQLPALLNALGKLEVLAGDFGAAQQDFQDVAVLAGEPRARAEAHYHAYRAALERRAWADALLEFNQALALDPGRFSPFPLERLQPQRILGAGGFGVAFLCRHRYLNAPVVVKALFADDLDRDIDRVFTEAQVLRRLDHPAIIRVTDCAYADEAAKKRPFLVMDYFEGPTLEEYVRQHGPLPPADLLAVGRLMAEALQTAHDNGILHRDVKPGNVLVRRSAGERGVSTPRWQIKLIDFGLALGRQAIQNTLNNAEALQQTLAGSSIAGTLDYAAPEQLGKLAGVSPGPAADVYGFGRTCCFALFGTPHPRRQHYQQVAEPLAELLDGCLAERPEERPANFQEVLQRLQNLGPVAEGKPDAGETKEERPAPPAERPTSPPQVLARREALVQAIWALPGASQPGVLTILGRVFTPTAGVVLILALVMAANFSSGEAQHMAAVLGPLSFLGLVASVGLLVIGETDRRRRRAAAWERLQRECEGMAKEYPETATLSALTAGRWSEEAAWDLVRYLEDRHLSKGVELRISYPRPGTVMTAMIPGKVVLDGRFLGNCTTHTGIKFSVATTLGSHELQVRWASGGVRRFPFSLRKEGKCEVEPNLARGSVEVHYL